jgi:hypothetical protein
MESIKAAGRTRLVRYQDNPSLAPLIRYAINLALSEFQFWYNHVRPHRHLSDATPAEAWAGVTPFAARIKSEHWFEAWEGLLQGYYLRR